MSSMKKVSQDLEGKYRLLQKQAKESGYVLLTTERFSGARQGKVFFDGLVATLTDKKHSTIFKLLAKNSISATYDLKQLMPTEEKSIGELLRENGLTSDVAISFALQSFHLQLWGECNFLAVKEFHGIDLQDYPIAADNLLGALAELVQLSRNS